MITCRTKYKLKHRNWGQTDTDMAKKMETENNLALLFDGLIE